MDTVNLKLSTSQFVEVLMALECSDPEYETGVGYAWITLRVDEAIQCAEWGVDGFVAQSNTGYCQYALEERTRYYIQITGYEVPYIVRIDRGLEEDSEYEKRGFMQLIETDPYLHYKMECWVRFNDYPVSKEDWDARQIMQATWI